MRERRIDRIRLCRTGSDERNLSALLMTNAGSSLNRTLSSMREILSDRSIVRNASNCEARDRKSTRLNSSHDQISYAVFCLKKKKHMYTVKYDVNNTIRRRISTSTQPRIKLKTYSTNLITLMPAVITVRVADSSSRLTPNIH